MKYLTRKAIMTNTLVVVGILASLHVPSHVISSSGLQQVPNQVRGDPMLITVRLHTNPDLIKFHHLEDTLESLQKSCVLVKLRSFFSSIPSSSLRGFEYSVHGILSILLQQGKNTIMSYGLAKEPRAPNLFDFTSQLPTNSIVKERKVCSS